MLETILTKIDTLFLRVSNLSNRYKRSIILILSVLSFLFIFDLNRMVFMCSDDYSYLFIHDSAARINSIADIIYSLSLYYMGWGGRLVAHFIALNLLRLDPLWVDVLNSIVYVLFIWLIYLHAKGKNKKHNISIFILINLFVWFFQPAFAETVFWTTGSANYLWCTSIILLFLLPYRLYSNNSVSSLRISLYSIGMFLFGIITGCTNENIAAAMLVMVILWMLLYRKHKWKIPLWAICGLIGGLIGVCCLVLAPGNFARAAVTGSEPWSLFFLYFKFNMATFRLVDNIGIILLIISILLILVLKFSKIKSRSSYVKVFLIYLLGTLISIYTMLISPVFPNRAWFGIVTLAIIAFALVFYELNNNLRFIRAIRFIIVCSFLCAFVFSYYKEYKEMKVARDFWIERDILIRNAVQSGKEAIKVGGISSSSKYVLSDGYWSYPGMSMYYGIEIQDINDHE